MSIIRCEQIRLLKIKMVVHHIKLNPLDKYLNKPFIIQHYALCIMHYPK